MTAKSKILALSEILLVYAVMQIAGIARRSTGVVEWEIQTLGWSYTGMFIFVGIPVLVIWLGRRDWATYGASFSDWQANLDLGFKGYLVRIIPLSILFISMQWFGMDYRTIPSGALVSIGGVVAIGLMLKILSRWNPSTGVSAARNNIVLTILLLQFPILLALFLNKLSVGARNPLGLPCPEGAAVAVSSPKRGRTSPVARVMPMVPTAIKMMKP